MPDPFEFDSTSPRFGLPLLFAGQAQKEVFVNEALSIADALLHCAVESVLSSPPASPADGANWIVGPSASDAWEDREDAIACRQAGKWIFVAPRDGLRAFNRETGQEHLFFGGWQIIDVPVEPIGGLVVDVEARAAIADLVFALRASGVFPVT